MQTLKAIILSAGQGSRLLPLTQNKPKCLLSIGGRSLLEWQLRALAANNIEHVSVVTGFYAEAVDEAIANMQIPGLQVETIYNPFYAVADNTGSCYVAREAMTGDFMVINGDTLFEPDLVAKSISQCTLPVTVTIDRKDSYDADDMKVCLDGDRLTRIDKSLPLDVVDAESIGMLVFNEEGGRHFKQAVVDLLRSENGLKSWYLRAVDALAIKGLVGTYSIEGYTWQEVDFPDDLKSAEALSAKWGTGLTDSTASIRLAR